MVKLLGWGLCTSFSLYASLAHGLFLFMLCHVFNIEEEVVVICNGWTPKKKEGYDKCGGFQYEGSSSCIGLLQVRLCCAKCGGFLYQGSSSYVCCRPGCVVPSVVVFGINVHPVCHRPGCVVPSAVIFGMEAVHPMFVTGQVLLYQVRWFSVSWQFILCFLLARLCYSKCSDFWYQGSSSCVVFSQARLCCTKCGCFRFQGSSSYVSYRPYCVVPSAVVLGIRAVHPVLFFHRPGCVVPSAVVFGIKAVHPMFFTYQVVLYQVLWFLVSRQFILCLLHVRLCCTKCGGFVVSQQIILVGLLQARLCCTKCGGFRYQGSSSCVCLSQARLCCTKCSGFWYQDSSCFVCLLQAMFGCSMCGGFWYHGSSSYVCYRSGCVVPSAVVFGITADHPCWFVSGQVVLCQV